MKERPILFSAPMVRALLDGSKTQTRRIAKLTANGHVQEPRGHRRWHPADPEAVLACPYGQPGDRLWVRETWGFNPDYPGQFGHICFRADRGHEHDGIKWVPSIHMPRQASRIPLEITGVRLERLQGISEEDARAEGVAFDPGEGGLFFVPGQAGCNADTAVGSYRKLWEAINGPDSWAQNPWVWVDELKVLRP